MDDTFNKFLKNSIANEIPSKLAVFKKSSALEQKSLSNIEKELLLYKINSIKNKKILIESTLKDEEKDTNLQEVKDNWEKLKTKIETFTKKYSKFIENKHVNDKIHKDYCFNIININYINELADFENNLFINNLTKNYSMDIHIIEYYIVINIIINKYYKTLVSLTNTPYEHKLLGSVMYEGGKEINEDNIFVVVGKGLSSNTINIIDIKGNKSDNVSQDTYKLIYDKLNIIKDINNLFLKSEAPTEETLDSSKVEKKKSRKKKKYNDLDEDSNIEVIQEQVIITNPKYKELQTLNSLDEFITLNESKKIYIYPNMFHRNIGEGYINAVRDGNLVKEICDDCGNILDKIDDWRNKLTKTYINISLKNGEIIPIVLDKKLFSSVAHYYLYNSHIDNIDFANQYLFEGKKGQHSISKEDFNLEINNSNFENTDNSLSIPNNVFELLRCTAAKFIQDEELATILRETNDITIMNAGSEDFSSGEYEISKELIMIRDYLNKNKILEFYQFEGDLELANKTRQTILEKSHPNFLTTVPKKQASSPSSIKLKIKKKVKKSATPKPSDERAATKLPDGAARATKISRERVAIDAEFPNYNFQKNIDPIKISSGIMATISDFHEDGRFFRDYAFLEETHNYIQWLFPIKTPSTAVSTDSVLKDEEIELLKSDEDTRTNIFKSLQTMIHFYGGTLIENPADPFSAAAGGSDYSPYDITFHSEAKERLENLNIKTHNYKRISRILKHLKFIGQPELQYAVIEYFIKAIYKNPYELTWNSTVKKSFQQHWIHTIENPVKILEFNDSITTLQTGGSTKSLENSYMMFPFKYRNKIYKIVYVIYNKQIRLGTEILGIFNDNGKITYDKDIEKNNILDKVLAKVCKKLLDNKLKIDKKTLVKLDYTKDKKNKVFYKGKHIGKYNKNGNIIFN